MSAALFNLLLQSIVETFIMVGASGAISVVIGLPLALVLVATDRGGIWEQPAINHVLGGIVNAVRSVPFIILMVAIIPLTRLLAGTSIGTEAAIVPLALAAVAFAARLFETALAGVDPGLIEAAQSMGASRAQIVTKVLVPEAAPGLIAATTVTLVSLVGYSAMAGAIGGGGLGDLGIRFGYQRFMPIVMAVVVGLLIVVVQALQSAGDALVRRLSHQR